MQAHAARVKDPSSKAKATNEFLETLFLVGKLQNIILPKGKKDPLYASRKGAGVLVRGCLGRKSEEERLQCLEELIERLVPVVACAKCIVNGAIRLSISLRLLWDSKFDNQLDRVSRKKI